MRRIIFEIYKSLLVLAAFLFCHQMLNAQGVGINTTSVASDAVLEIESIVGTTPKGLLIPRVVSYLNVTAASDGLLVYDTTEKKFYFWDASQWVELNPFNYSREKTALSPEEDHLTFQFKKPAVPGIERNMGIDVLLPKSKLTVMGNLSIGDNAVAAPADGAYVKGKVIADSDITVNPTGQFVGYGTIPLGGIIMWSGLEGTVPTGWALCDGRVDYGYTTPNLKGQFVVGYDLGNTDYDEPGNLSTLGTTTSDSGGDSTHVLTPLEMPSHSHTLNITTDGDHQHRALIDSGGGGPYGTNLGPDNSMWTDDDPGSAQSSGYPIANGFLPTDYQGSHAHSNSYNSNAGGGAAHENRPPYYVLAFIMRVQ